MNASPPDPAAGTGSPDECARFGGVPLRESTRLDTVMRLTARHMLASHSQTAPVTVFSQADASELVRLRALAAATNAGAKPSYSHLLVKLVAAALALHPRLNAALVEDTLQVFDAINIGLAMALPDGNLVVPVIHGADQLSLQQIALRAADLQARARTGKLGLADMQRGTFTLSNAGMLPSVRWTTPLLNPPQCAILATGAIAERAVVREGAVCVRWMLDLSLTFDHRALNGLVASAFVDTLVGLIAQPAAALGLTHEISGQQGERNGS